jgi:putative ABC transport system substrate-binding protein
MPVVGFVNGASAQTFARPAAAFLKGLGETGYADGRNVTIEYHWAEGRFDRIPEIVADLIHRRVSVIAATPAALAAKEAARTIPVVFEMGSDPVKLGVVASLSRPGGTQDTAPKLLELLHELLPATHDIALLINPDDPITSEVNRTAVQAAANSLGLELQIVDISGRLRSIQFANDLLIGKTQSVTIKELLLKEFTPYGENRLHGAGVWLQRWT